MKLKILILLCALPAIGSFGQSGASVVIVESALSIESRLDNTNATITQLLSEAEKQTGKLEDTLKQISDPAKVHAASVTLIKNAIVDSAKLLKNEAEQRAMMSNLTGAEVFTDDALGVMEPIGATVTKEDGTVVNRDPERYRLESAVVAQVREFKRVREEALTRKKELTEQLGDVFEQLEIAEDLGNIQKLDAMMRVLKGEIEECNQTILIAQADVEMTEKELIGQAQVMAKAKQEENNINNAPDPSGAAPKGGTFPGFGAAPKKLPWGRKGSQSGAPATQGAVP